MADVVSCVLGGGCLRTYGVDVYYSMCGCGKVFVC